MYLLDTNAISEFRKLSINSKKTNLGFKDWANSVDSRLFFISHIVILELRKGALLKARKDPQQGLAYSLWIDFLLNTMGDRVLSVSDEICWRCAELHIPNPRPQFDSLIASTALVHNLILITDNTKDFNGIDGLHILNPFTSH